MGKHICDCGEHYDSLAAIEACQANNHGIIHPKPDEPVKIINKDEIMEHLGRIEKAGMKAIRSAYDLGYFHGENKYRHNPPVDG